MNNRLTISTLVCPAWSLERIVDACVANGISGIDFRGIGDTLDHSVLPAFTTDFASTKALLQSHGLRVPCMNASVKLMEPDEAKWKNSLEEYERYLALADTFESDFVRIFPGQTPNNMDRGDALTMARRRARQLVKLAHGHRCKPILETHDDWGAASEVLKLLADCEPTQFPVLWDVRHTFAATESPEEAIATLGPWLAHVHVKDSVMIDGKEEPALLGEGIVTVGEALRALSRVGYAGWICLETEKRWRPKSAPEPEVSIPQFADFARAH